MLTQILLKCWLYFVQR